MGASLTLKKFAKNREKAYSITNTLNAARARAITRIKNVAEHFSQKSERVQLSAVMQLEKEIQILLPDEESRFSKMRADMLNIITSSKNQRNGLQEKR